MLQGDAHSPIRPPCSDSSRLPEEPRGVRNHPDPVNGASGPAPSNAPQPSTAAASSSHPALPPVRAGLRLSGHEDTRRQRLFTVHAGVRRTSRATAGRAPGRLIEEGRGDSTPTNSGGESGRAATADGARGLPAAWGSCAAACGEGRASGNCGERIRQIVSA